MSAERLTIFDDKRLAAVASLAEVSTEVFAASLMAEHFSARMSRQHKKACAFLDSRTCCKKNMKSARGFGKTSLVLMSKAAQAILYNKANFIVYITNTLPRAIMRTENLKRELLTNPLIRQIWPSIKISEAAIPDMDEEFSKNCWVAFGRTIVVPMGMGQTPRGLLFGRFRPDLLIVDDAQKIEALQNEEMRQSDFEWLRGDVEEAVNPYSDAWEVVHTDTVKHQDGLTERLDGLRGWNTLSLPVAEFRADGLLYSLMPELVSHEKIRENYESARDGGTLDVFYREKLCRAQSDETLVFRPEYFRRIDETDFCLARSRHEMDSIVLVDPARTANPASCESGVVGWTVDRYKPALYCRRAIGRRVLPDELADLAIDTALEIGAHVLGIEVTGLGEYATYPLVNRMRRRGLNFKIVELHAKGGVTDRGKIERVKSLLPFYRRGEVFHIAGQCDRLEKQLLSFPHARFWDLMDAAAYVVEALAQGDQFWMPPEFDALSDREAAVKEWEAIKREAEREYVPSRWGCC